MAVRAPEIPDGMYLSAGSPVRSLRPAYGADGERLLIVGGENHKAGQEPDTGARYEALERWAREQVGATEVVARWSAQDYMSVDGVPFIGRLTPGTGHLWVGTGYGKWGMTNGTVAGMILSDLIAGRQNPWAETFDATRANLARSASELASHNADAVGRLVGGRLGAIANTRSADELEPGDGGIVRVDGELVAAARGDDGTLHKVSPWCTHMGCPIAFNRAERTWDCPCHGSRYDIAGHVIQGPATDDLTTG